MRRLVLNSSASFKDVAIDQALKDKLSFRARQTSDYNSSATMVPSVIGTLERYAPDTTALDRLPIQLDYDIIRANSYAYNSSGALTVPTHNSGYAYSYGIGKMFKGVRYRATDRIGYWSALSEEITFGNTGSLPYEGGNIFRLYELSETTPIISAQLPANGNPILNSVQTTLAFICDYVGNNGNHGSLQPDIFYKMIQTAPNKFRIQTWATTNVADPFTGKRIAFAITTGGSDAQMNVSKPQADLFDVYHEEDFTTNQEFICDETIYNTQLTKYNNWLIKPLDCPASQRCSDNIQISKVIKVKSNNRNVNSNQLRTIVISFPKRYSDYS